VATLGPVRPLFQTVVQVVHNFVALIVSAMRSPAQIAAENRFLRKQLALWNGSLAGPMTPRV